MKDGGTALVGGGRGPRPAASKQPSAALDASPLHSWSKTRVASPLRHWVHSDLSLRWAS